MKSNSTNGGDCGAPKFMAIAPDECLVSATSDDRIEISLKSWGFAPRIVRLNWLLANQLAADLERVVEQLRVLNREGRAP